MPKSFRLDPFGRVGEAIMSWQPRGCKTEKDYENSLERKLKRELVNQKIDKQYGSGRQRVDIVVQDKIPIELKMNLTNNAQLHRLIGQLNDYMKKWDKIIILFCGDVRRDLFDDLCKHVNPNTVHFYYFREPR